jgi:hypothetical protein
VQRAGLARALARLLITCALSLRASILFSLRAWLWQRRGLLVVTLAAFAVRLEWNLRIHRLVDFVYSDMEGYLDRANLMIDKPELTSPWLALFPYGTHFFIFAVRSVFGRKSDDALGAAFAVLGALAVGYTYATAQRYCTRAWARRVVGLLLIVYYPWISLGSYALSEIPFAFCVAGAAFYGLRLADDGCRGDAWGLGLFIGMGAAVRPQILLAAVFLALHLVFRRDAWKRFTWGLVVRAAVPLAVVLAFSAYRLHKHTGSLGLVSTNGPLNFVFGRCHNTSLEAKTRDSESSFGPPPLGSLREFQKAHPGSIIKLDPAFGEELIIQAHMWDAAPNYRLAARCVKRTGYLRQARYAITHVVLLWGYNIIWPDEGQEPRWRVPMELFCKAHDTFILPPAALALLLAFQRRRARSMLLALHVWSVIVIAMVYFGDTRYRAPYDGLLIVLAVQTCLEVGLQLRRGAERLRMRLTER